MLAVLGQLDWVYMFSKYLTEDGFMHLRFVQIIEKDGRKDGKREPLYFISHELDQLRYYLSLPRDELAESRKKYCLTGLVMTKALLYLSNLNWISCLVLPQLVFVPEMITDLLGVQLKEYEEQSKKEQKVMGHRIGEYFDKFENRRLLITCASAVGLILLLPIFTLRSDQAGQNIFYHYLKSVTSSSYGLIVTVLVGKLILLTPNSKVKPQNFRTAKISIWLALMVIVVLFTESKLPAILVISAELLRRRERNVELIMSGFSVILFLYASIFADFEFGLIDLLFVSALVFMHQVGKYKPGAVRLANLFTFM